MNVCRESVLIVIMHSYEPMTGSTKNQLYMYSVHLHENPKRLK